MQTLRDDVKKIRGLLAQADTLHSRAPEMRAGVIRELCMLLEIVDQLEERFLFPALARFPDASKRVAECDASRLELRQLVERVRQTDGILNELVEDTRAHLVLLEGLLRPELDALDRPIAEFQAERMRDPRYADARPEIVQNPDGGEQLRTKKPAA